MLDLKMLKAMPPYTVFATGTTYDTPEGVNMTTSGRKLRWAAVRGEIYDWTIYIHFAEKTINWVKCYGDKVLTTRNIRKLVECNNQALEMYRY